MGNQSELNLLQSELALRIESSFSNVQSGPEYEAWLAERRLGIGGSDAGTILGLNKYKTPFELWLEKTNQLAETFAGNRFTHFGTILEQVVADEFERITGKRVFRVNKSLVHPEYPFMRANLDRRVVGERALLECKTASAWANKDDWGPSGTDLVPFSYHVQCQHYLAVTGYERAYLAVMLGGNDFRIYVIERDAELIATLIEREAEFWRCVETITPPDPTLAAEVTQQWPREEKGKMLAADSDIAAALEEMQQIKLRMAADKKQLDELAESLKLLIKDHEGIVDAAGKVLATFKYQAKTTIDTKRLKAEKPEIAAAYSQTSETRVFKLKGEK